MLELKIKDVILAARKAFDKGELSNQNGSNDPTRALYRDANGFPCAIGAAIDDEAAKKWDRLTFSSIGDIVSGGFVSIDKAEFNDMASLQLLHDLKLSSLDEFDEFLKELEIKYNVNA